MTTQKNQKNRLINTSEAAQVKNDQFPIVGIGASAGGLDAIKKLLDFLPVDTGLAFVVVQHLAANQESMLPEILSRSTKMTVQKVSNEMRIEPNNVYVIPSGTTMTIDKETLKLHPKLDSLKPIDEFLNSLALERKTQAIGIILSGTGTDGTEGLRNIKAEGGITFAQDPKTAQYPDMPKSAIASEAVDFVLSPEQISEELKSIIAHPEITRQKIEAETSKTKEASDLQSIFALLKASSGVNFSGYKKNTITRRITRRMILKKIETTRKYVTFLREHPEERQALFDDMLINVTGFFREPNTFSIFKEKVVPDLVKKHQHDSPLRAWVPGCSTGEEAYSVAIALAECLEENNQTNIQIQIFGTDINIKNVETARRGIYPKTVEDHISAGLLQKYFIKLNGNYQITKQIRDKCVFAKHDITQDPPFSNLDLIFCRNVLIYIESSLQEKIISLFNYALKPNGYLVLGESESIGKFTTLFESTPKRSPIFRKKSGQPIVELPLQSSSPFSQETFAKTPLKKDSITKLQEEVDQLLLGQYVPATLLVNDNSDILIIRGQVDPFISIEPGAPSFSVAKIVRKELRPTVQTAIYRAKKALKDIQETIRFEDKKKARTVKIQVKHLKSSKQDEPLFLILFEENTKKLPEEETMAKQPDRDKDQQQIKELSEDLETTKQTLQTVIEQQEATNEELRSANEEVQSSNEELMSTNEELETSKEELQSTNEELNTLNDELKNRNVNLGHLNDDLANLMNNIDTAVVIVDNDFKIKRFTVSAQELLRLSPADVDRPITDLRLGIPIDDLQEPLSESISKLSVIRKEIYDGKGHWFQMRIRPYITEDKKIGGAVLSFAEITEMKKWEGEKKLYTNNLEEQVRVQTEKVLQSENLASIGKTAGMVGHDIRNPLQAITSDLFLLKTSLGSIPPGEDKDLAKESLQGIEKNIEYINKIVADLQDYARTPKIQTEDVDVDAVFRGVASSLTIPKEVGVSISIAKDFPKLKLDSSCLKRILTNLVSNAVQAISNGGKIIFSATYKQDKALISVEDTGDGISEEDKAKIFSPLFTTKSKGQGFGLVVVKKLTEAMGGTVEFESKKGKGTKFTLTFPIT